MSGDHKGRRIGAEGWNRWCWEHCWKHWKKETPLRDPHGSASPWGIRAVGTPHRHMLEGLWPNGNPCWSGRAVRRQDTGESRKRKEEQQETAVQRQHRPGLPAVPPKGRGGLAWCALRAREGRREALGWNWAQGKGIRGVSLCVG